MVVQFVFPWTSAIQYSGNVVQQNRNQEIQNGILRHQYENSKISAKKEYVCFLVQWHIDIL